MDYTKLDGQHKRQLINNSQALWIAAKCLERITGTNGDEWIAEIAKNVSEDTKLMSNKEIDEMIVEIEQQFNTSGILHIKY